MGYEIIDRAELKALIKEAIYEVGINAPTQQTQPIKYVYGQKGIATLFNSSIATASRILKSGVIDEAVSRCNRKIVVNADLALELVNKKKGGRKWNK